MATPTFGIALVWETPERAQQAATLVRELAVTFPREKATKVEVVKRPTSVVLFLELDYGLYGRAVLKDVEERTAKAGGQLVELQRMGDGERAQFKAKFLVSPLGPNSQHEAYSGAAKAIQDHLDAVRAGTVAWPAAPPPPVPSQPAGAPAAARAARAPAGINLRKDIRLDVELEVEFKSETEFVTEYTRNLSKGGVFVKTGQRPKQNTWAALKLHLPDGRHLETTARVVHVLDHPEFGGVGLAFEKRDPAFEAELAKYLASVAGKVPVSS